MQLLTMKELMDLLKVKRNTVYQLRRQGLPSIHLGRSVRFDLEEVVAWVRSKRVRETPGANEIPAAEKGSLTTAVPGRASAGNEERQVEGDFLL